MNRSDDVSYCRSNTSNEDIACTQSKGVEPDNLSACNHGATKLRTGGARDG